MATQVTMPQLSDTMHQGKILAWRKNEGDVVKRGDILAEVETDKANLEIEAFKSGILLKIATPAQSSAKVGEVIAWLGDAGEQVPSASTTSTQPAVINQAPATAPTPAVEPSPAPTQFSSSSDERIKVSPLARKVAQQRNVDLTSIRGSGPNGRIVRKDVELAPTSSAAPSMSVAGAAPRATMRSAPQAEYTTSPGSGKSAPLSKMRDTIARRMQQSVQEAPHFYTTTTIVMDEAQKLREVLKARPDFKGISLNHLVIKASAYALAHEPAVNRAMRDGLVFEPDQINIGIITAIDDGLLIPVIKAADQLPLKDLVFEARAAVERARAGRPSSTDLVGGTFSISNMGMFDVENFTAIINPGQGAILAVSSVKEMPMVRSGQIVIGQQMKVTLSVDHRIIDGVMSGKFLQHFKQALETPALLLL